MHIFMLSGLAESKQKKKAAAMYRQSFLSLNHN